MAKSDSDTVELSQEAGADSLDVQIKVPDTSARAKSLRETFVLTAVIIALAIGLTFARHQIVLEDPSGDFHLGVLVEMHGVVIALLVAALLVKGHEATTVIDGSDAPARALKRKLELQIAGVGAGLMLTISALLLTLQAPNADPFYQGLMTEFFGVAVEFTLGGVLLLAINHRIHQRAGVRGLLRDAVEQLKEAARRIPELRARETESAIPAITELFQETQLAIKELQNRLPAGSQIERDWMLTTRDALTNVEVVMACSLLEDPHAVIKLLLDRVDRVRLETSEHHESQPPDSNDAEEATDSDENVVYYEGEDEEDRSKPRGRQD